jgi:pyruvate dehydrogenase (quinone)
MSTVGFVGLGDLGSRMVPHLLRANHSVAKAGDLEESIKTWLAQPGPALLDVKVNPMQLVMPPSPFMAPEAVIGMGVYTAKAVLEGKGRDVWEMMMENIP